jgi:hypothetical protein
MLTTIDSARLMSLCDQLMDGHIHYGFGAKAALGASPASIHAIDCSGFVRYLMYQATNGHLTMPDGSWIQQEWCDHRKLKAVTYSSTAANDPILRIAFLPPTTHHHHHHAGHVWLILGGQTIESHGGAGPSRRPWNTPILLNNVQHCYELARTTLIGSFDLPKFAYA